MGSSFEKVWRNAFDCGHGDTEKIFHKLSSLYSQPHRTYHILDHVNKCLGIFDNWKSENPVGQFSKEISTIVQLALWFHDVIYDVDRTPVKGNESRSAAFFLECAAPYKCLMNGIPERVVEAILATEHSIKRVKAYSSLCSSLTVDCDLAILGDNPYGFSESTKLIRQEMPKLSEDEFFKGQTNFLKNFITRGYIYQLDWFVKKYEAQARENIFWMVEVGNLGLESNRVHDETQYKNY